MRRWRAGREGRTGRRPAIQPLLLAAAALWLLLTVLVVAGIRPVYATSRNDASSNIAATGTDTATVPTATPTQPPPAPTATDTPAPAPTDTAAPADTPTDTPVPSDNGGGGGGGGGGGVGGSGSSGDSGNGAGPDVTRVVFSQPTVAAGNDKAVPGLAGTTFGANGLLIASAMSCVAGLLGLTVAGIALSALLRRGYGPFLRALLHGKRAGMRRGKRGKDDGYDVDGGFDAFYATGASPGRGGANVTSGTRRGAVQSRAGRR